MGSFLRSLFGPKKSNSKIKTRLQSRRLELLGLEERITPATVTNAAGVITFTLDANTAETFSNLSTLVNGAIININAGSNIGLTGSNLPSGVTIENSGANAFVKVDTAVFNTFAGIEVIGQAAKTESVTIGSGGIDLSAAPGGANQSVSIIINQGGTDTLNVNGVIKTKGTGAVNLNSSNGSMTIAGTGDITTTAGNVDISALNLHTSGDITTGSGNIHFGSALNLDDSISLNSTSGDVTFGIVTSGSKNFSITTGGTVKNISPTDEINIVNGNLTINSASTATGSSNSAILLTKITSAGVVQLNASGDIKITSTVSAASVNAKSTAGDVIFANTVTTSSVGGFTSEASDATKATRIANLVDVQNGANALVIGNLVATADTTPQLKTAVAGTINITGKIDGAAATNDLTLTAANGTITIGGAVGASGPLDELNAAGKTSFTANGAVTGEYINIGFSQTDFATSISFADTVKGTGTGFAVGVGATGAGTIYFAKGIEITNPGGDMYLESVNGSITVTGNILGKSSVSIESVSGAISVAGVTVDQTQANIRIISDTGNITTTGEISAKGSSSYIDIFNNYGGDITIGVDVSTGTNGNIYLSIGDSSTGVVNGNMNINGALNTTGISNGRGINILSGCAGVVNVNKAISTNGYIEFDIYSPATSTLNVAQDATITGDTVLFSAQNTNNTINLASGANVTAVSEVYDFGTGNLNLGSNITVTGAYSDIQFDSVAINLTGPVSMKAPGILSYITLASVNGAQNLTLEAADTIQLGSVGQSIPLGTVTVTNSAGVTASDFSAANVVLSNTTGTIAFAGPTNISSTLTTTANAYNISFNGTTVLAGAPVFLNTGNISFAGITSLTSGATITGGPATNVNLAGTIVSGGAFNIGANILKANISNGTTLNLASSTNESTFASRVILPSGFSFGLNGVGTLTLSGDSSDPMHVNGFVGITNVTNGTLNVTGSLCQASGIFLRNGTLTGNGQVGIVTSTAASTVAPSGTITMDNFAQDVSSAYKVSIYSSSTSSQILMPTTIPFINNSILNLSSVVSGLRAGNQFKIIDAAGSTQITGNFQGLPEGATFSTNDSLGNTVTFAISYVGGTGNDVTLTVTNVSIANPSAIPQPMVAGQPLLNYLTAVGAGAGGGPMVTVTLDIIPGLTTVPTYFSFFAYDAGFTGGVRVALNELDGNEDTREIITGPGPGGGPNVKVFQFNLATLTFNPTPVTSFFAFNDPNFNGGVYVAGGDVTGDGIGDLLVGAGEGGGPRVQVYAGSVNGVITSAPISDFFAYSTAFTGGVVVAAGDRTGDSTLEVVTGPASNGGYNIKSFNVAGTGNNPTLIENFFAFNDFTSIGGLSIATLSLDANPMDDLVIGTTNTQFGVILNQNYAGIQTSPFPGFTGAIRAGFAYDQLFNTYKALAAAGPGGGPVISTFSVDPINQTLTQTDSLFVLDPEFTGGLFVAN